MSRQLPDVPIYEGAIVDGPDFSRLAEAMVESTTEFDFAPGREWSIPDDLRRRLVEWCADLHAWDRAR